MQETWDQSLGWEHPLEKDMATHSSILAWETPGTEEPGGLQSMGSQESDMTEQLNSNNCIKKELMKCRDKRVDHIKDHQLEKARLS